MLADIQGHGLRKIHSRRDPEAHPFKTLGEYQTGNTWLVVRNALMQKLPEHCSPAPIIRT